MFSGQLPIFFNAFSVFVANPQIVVGGCKPLGSCQLEVFDSLAKIFGNPLSVLVAESDFVLRGRDSLLSGQLKILNGLWQVLIPTFATFQHAR